MNSDYSILIPPVAKLLGCHGIEAGFLIPTGTAMSKAIMDATWPLREYLVRTGFHDFRQQGQGAEAKRVVPIQIIQARGLVAGKMSLYRPDTKDGDPRIWIYGLPDYAAPGDLIALIVDRGQLYAVNCTRDNLASQLANPATFLGQLASRLDVNAPAAAELLARLRGVGARGFIPSMRPGRVDSRLNVTVGWSPSGLR